MVGLQGFLGGTGSPEQRGWPEVEPKICSQRTGSPPRCSRNILPCPGAGRPDLPSPRVAGSAARGGTPIKNTTQEGRQPMPATVRSARPLPAVEVTARFVGPTDGTLRRLMLGLPVPAIIATGQGETGYLLSAHLDR